MGVRGMSIKGKTFLKRKNIEVSVKRYFGDAFSAMALGLFSSLLIGLIIKTIGVEFGKIIGQNIYCDFLIETGNKSMEMMGAAMGAAIAWGLKAPPLVIFASTITGMMGAAVGGPAGAFISVAFGAEFGKAISKETRVDIILTPIVTILIGGLVSIVIGPMVGKLMYGLGNIVVLSAELHPFFAGLIIAIVVGLALTAPISSAALCIMLNLRGLAAGAATVGCCAQMVGFAVISYRENGIGGFIAQGLGTSMLQISNIFKNPWIILPPTIGGAIAGVLSTTVFKMTNNALGAGMGTSGFVGQIGTFTTMGFSLNTLVKVLIIQFLIPVVISILVDRFLRKKGKIKSGDYKLEI